MVRVTEVPAGSGPGRSLPNVRVMTLSFSSVPALPSRIEDGCICHYPAHFLLGGLCHKQPSRWEVDRPDPAQILFHHLRKAWETLPHCPGAQQGYDAHNFKRGRIYFLQQGIYPSRHTTTRYAPMTLEDAKREIQAADYYDFDSGKPGKVMSEKDYREDVAYFEKENREDPAHYKVLLNYKVNKSAK
jgi:hypothetical protein